MGRFVVFEGLDFSGKTLQSKILTDKLREQDIECVLTREPGEKSLEFCKIIRELIEKEQLYRYDEKTKALLFLADRAYHVNKFIMPTLFSGNSVIADRYYFSALTYNSELESLYFVNDEITKMAKPDIVIYIDISYETFCKRREQRGIQGVNDDMSEEQFENRRKAYMDVLFSEYEKDNIGQLIVINDDGQMEPELINKKIMKEIAKCN